MGFTTAVSAVIAAGMTVAASADQIKAGADNYPRGRISSFADGVVKFRTPDRALHGIPITTIDQMVVDSVGGLKDFNAAEDYLFRSQPAAAALRYERALRGADGFWPDLIRVRLLQARDRAGHFDKAVVQFIHVAEILPHVAGAMIPESIPARPDDTTRRALELIESAIERNAGREAEPALQRVRYAILRRVDPRRAAELAPAIAALPSARGGEWAAEPAYRLQVDALQLLLEQRRRAAVVEGVDQLLESAPDSVAPELLLLKGRASYLAGLEGDDSEAFLRAGLAFMRVAVHFPADSRAGEALYWAARVHERVNRPTQAVQLLRECLDRKDLSDATRAAARTMLKRLID
ncbi:MAG: hypothetical protein JSV19_07645 [Phycisphaerales bacterium]|nr:MAG: hypothetical protein JSV19_07645 [Phycisphaerales bacterium]